MKAEIARHLIFSSLAAGLVFVSARGQEPILERLQEKMDRQEAEQKGLVYSFNTVTYVHKLDNKGVIEKTDTIKTWQKFRGDSLQEYTLLYSSDKREGKDKKEKRESSQLPKLTDPAYDFRVDQESGRITFSPKKARKGDLAGELLYDPQSLELRQLKAAMPRLKWPVNEFELEMKFITADGLLFPSEFRMQAGWNAIVSQGRIRVESRNSDFRIY
jgi:hypothetical protein